MKDFSSIHHFTRKLLETYVLLKETHGNGSIDEIKCEPVEDFSNVESEQTNDFSDQLERKSEFIDGEI